MAISRGPLRGPRPWENGLPPPQRKSASGIMSEALNPTSGDDVNVTIAVPKHLLSQIQRIIQMNANNAQQTAAEATIDQAAETAQTTEQLQAAANETASRLDRLNAAIRERTAAARTAVTGSTAKKVAKAIGIAAGIAGLAGGAFYAYRRYAGA